MTFNPQDLIVLHHSLSQTRHNLTHCLGLYIFYEDICRQLGFPFLSINFPSSPVYGVFISRLLWYARACFSNQCVFLRAARHLSSSDKDMSGNVWNRPSGIRSFMVDIGISSNIMKPPSPKCNMTFLFMIIYSDTLSLSDIAPICELITEQDLITELR